MRPDYAFAGGGGAGAEGINMPGMCFIVAEVGIILSCFIIFRSK